MGNENETAKKTWLIDWRAKIGNRRVTGTVRMKAYVQPTRHLSYSIARDAAAAYANHRSVQSLVVLGVGGLDRKPTYNTKEWIGYSN